MSDESPAKYMLGHSEAEMKRLMLQADVLRPFTESLLTSAGAGLGMRVLDVGCGAGDVSMLAAGVVGPSGAVIGIDRSPDAIGLARRRAERAGLQHVVFKVVPLEAFSDPVSFDFVIGRYILFHQSDPVDFLRTAARFVRPGGFIAFHEIDAAASCNSTPSVWRWDTAGNLAAAAFRDALPHYDLANRLIELFHDAGLGVPNLRRETPVGGGESSPLYAWIAETLRSVWPRLVQMGIAAGTGPTDTLEANIRTAVVEARSQIQALPQVCAWARI
jgi:SAM-dependent methyltransferase